MGEKKAQGDPPSEILIPPRNSVAHHFVTVSCFYVLRLLPQPDFLGILHGHPGICSLPGHGGFSAPIGCQAKPSQKQDCQYLYSPLQESFTSCVTYVEASIKTRLIPLGKSCESCGRTGRLPGLTGAPDWFPSSLSCEQGLSTRTVLPALLFCN